MADLKISFVVALSLRRGCDVVSITHAATPSINNEVFIFNSKYAPAHIVRLSCSCHPFRVNKSSKSFIFILVAFKRTKFPLPAADLNFYTSRLKNLEGIYSQLRDPRVKRMAHYLEDTKSVYLSCFKSMLTNVVAGKIYFCLNSVLEKYLIAI